MTKSNLPTLAESQGDICYDDKDYDKPYTPQPVEINNRNRDRLLSLMDRLELEVNDLVDRNYSRALPKLGKAIARLETAREMWDIINGNS